MDIKKLITGTVITLVIGGTAYTVNQADVIKNFASDTGITQEQAEQYINSIDENELASFDEVGSLLIDEGKNFINGASEIDCVEYEYSWESTSLSCYQGKTQLEKIGGDALLLGQAYKKLNSDSASKDDISKTIELIDRLNSDYQSKIISSLVDWSDIDDARKTNSYNKALLQAALESE
jgi:hypothetical protein